MTHCCPCCGTSEPSCGKAGRDARKCCSTKTLRRVFDVVKPLSVCAQCRNTFASGAGAPQPLLCVRCTNLGWEVRVQRTGVLAGPDRVERT